MTTDEMFEKRCPGYYTFGKDSFKRECMMCGKKFETTLRLLKCCSPKCFEEMLNALCGKLKK